MTKALLTLEDQPVEVIFCVNDDDVEILHVWYKGVDVMPILYYRTLDKLADEAIAVAVAQDE